jgi:hypothetical protein
MAVRILALVGDAYGGLGGIARYNRDLFQALSAAGAEILVIPRLGDAAGAVPPGVRQWPAIRGRLGFSLASLWRAWRHRPIDVVFCGHVFMAPWRWRCRVCWAPACGCRRMVRKSGGTAARSFAAPSRVPTSSPR